MHDFRPRSCRGNCCSASCASKGTRLPHPAPSTTCAVPRTTTTPASRYAKQHVRTRSRRVQRYVCNWQSSVSEKVNPLVKSWLTSLHTRLCQAGADGGLAQLAANETPCEISEFSATLQCSVPGGSDNVPRASRATAGGSGQGRSRNCSLNAAQSEDVRPQAIVSGPTRRRTSG